MEYLVLSSYPEKFTTHGRKTVGVASYTKNTLLSIRKRKPSIKFTVIAEVLENYDSYLDDGNIKVERLWKRNSIGGVLAVANRVLFCKTKNILLPFEMYMFGNFAYTVLFIPILYIFRLFGKNIILILHQVVDDITLFEKNPLRRSVYQFLRGFFYRVLIVPCSTVIVFEQELKARLDSNKVVVIPHAVESVEMVDKKRAMKLLGWSLKKKYILYFGFISPYKGVDDLITSWEPNDKYELVIAGGPNPNHIDEDDYMDYISRVKKQAKKKGVKITGFIPEDKIKLYFSSCDYVVFPYKTFMSSSGPLSMALAYEKAIILSQSLAPYFKTQDLKLAASRLGIDVRDMVVNFKNYNLMHKLDEMNRHYDKYIVFSREVKKVRSWDNISDMYINFIGD